MLKFIGKKNKWVAITKKNYKIRVIRNYVIGSITRYKSSREPKTAEETHTMWRK